MQSCMIWAMFFLIPWSDSVSFMTWQESQKEVHDERTDLKEVKDEPADLEEVKEEPDTDDEYLTLAAVVGVQLQGRTVVDASFVLLFFDFVVATATAEVL